ncbi:MAG: DUF896 family protein [Streptococcaceae bacterium]|nr:DUF896 family protein [Streptococcaceae bacterium]
MMNDEKIARINALAHKAKTEGLTDLEKEEQQELRKAYLASVKKNLRHHIEGIKVVDPTGQDITPEKLKQIQKQKGLHGR